MVTLRRVAMGKAIKPSHGVETMVTLFNASRFKLQSMHNGLAYILEDKRHGLELFVQGDDALEFEQELQDATRVFADRPYDYVAAHLWDACGYGDVATPVDANDGEG